jgi:hypothetical protein
MRIPITAVRELAKKYKLTHVIVFGFDGEQQHVATYGKSVIDCSQAADFGNTLKDKLGWPESLHAQPARVTKLHKNNLLLLDRIKELEAQVEEYKRGKL